MKNGILGDLRCVTVRDNYGCWKYNQRAKTCPRNEYRNPSQRYTDDHPYISIFTLKWVKIMNNDVLGDLCSITVCDGFSSASHMHVIV